MKSYLRKWGMQINPTCPYCQHTEDTHHAIVNCQTAQELWSDIQPLLMDIARQPIKTDMETLVFHRNLPNDDQAKEICHYVLATAAEALWHTRNKKVYDSTYRLGNMKNKVIGSMVTWFLLLSYLGPIFLVLSPWSCRLGLVALVWPFRSCHLGLAALVLSPWFLALSLLAFIDVILHCEIEARDVNVREVIEDFCGQVDSYTDIFEAVVLMAPGRYI
ncbi:Hypothetical predicted protein [Paramuricea clavata]|uniref:Uncharacterized protein n=1 Tax=Paramuricea clavata TaxID=317549 RepID=A0A6S7KB01_PARCT|nr:Hypothetical predicted protein [Paramuricea clavata]